MIALDAYRAKYQGKPTAIKIIVPVATELFPEYVKPKPIPQPAPPPIVAADPLEKPSHIALLHQVMQEEDQVRQYRESLRMRYYELEDKKAPRIEFQRNHAAITEQSKKLQELYIRRRHIEIHGKAPEKRSILTEDENNALRRLKYDRDRLIDKSGKLKKKNPELPICFQWHRQPSPMGVGIGRDRIEDSGN